MCIACAYILVQFEPRYAYSLLLNQKEVYLQALLIEFYKEGGCWLSFKVLIFSNIEIMSVAEFLIHFLWPCNSFLTGKETVHFIYFCILVIWPVYCISCFLHRGYLTEDGDYRFTTSFIPLVVNQLIENEFRLSWATTHRKWQSFHSSSSSSYYQWCLHWINISPRRP